MYPHQIEDILRLAADSDTAIQAELTATPEVWQLLGTDGVRVWGQYQQNPLLEVVIALSIPLSDTHAWHCSCAQARPCEHILGLYLLWDMYADLFTSGTFPFQTRKTTDAQPRGSVATPIQLTTVRQGLHALNQWCTTLLRNGLAQPQVRTYPFWDAIADRMLAARMPGLSQWLREVGTIAVRRTEWVEPVLRELGLMVLLAQSMDRYEQLKAETQADLCDALGWVPNEERSGTSVADQWVVLGYRHRLLRDETPELLMWVYGVQNRRPAILHAVGANAVMAMPACSVGDAFEAELVYKPSRAPLKVHTPELYTQVPLPSVKGDHIEAAITQFGTALAHNPWTRYYPMLLEEVVVTRFGNGWSVRHPSGTYLPIAPYFRHKWVLHAAHGGTPVHIAGTWDGSSFFPLCAFTPQGVVLLDRVVPYHVQRNKPRAF